VQRAHETVQLLICETPGVNAPILWPDNSPDLNLVDHQIWGKLQEHVYHSRIHDVAPLIKEWECFNQMIIDEADRQ